MPGTMLFFALGILVVLMYRLGMFQELISYREMKLLDEHVMQAYDDGMWIERMDAFRETHPGLVDRSYMTLGRRR